MKYVLVETISSHFMRYVITLEDDSPPEWAADTVVMDEALEFSQKYLGETVLSHRVVTREEVLALCDQDNPYLQEWSEDQKFTALVTGVKS